MESWQTSHNIRIQKVSDRRCNCYLISKDNRFFLVDSGTRPYRPALERNLKALGVRENGGMSLILTHCHFDHAENASKIKTVFGADIWVHAGEAACLRKGENPVIRGSMFLTKPLIHIMNRAGWAKHLLYPPVEPDLLVDERLDLDSFGIPGYILHTPGHTSGSMSVIVDDEIALVGDTLFGIFPGCVFPPFADSPDLLLKSWKKLLDTGCRLFLPAHGSSRTRELLLQAAEKYGRRFGF